MKDKTHHPPPSYEDVIEGLAEGVVVVGTDLKVSVFNQSAEKIFETSRQLVLGRPAHEVFAKNQRLIEMLKNTLDEGKLFAEYEEKIHRRFSGPVPAGITTSHVFDANGALIGAAALVKDMTGIKSLESGTLRKERLAYIGTFAASLAHEIRNPLSGIKGAAQLLSKRTKDHVLSEYAAIVVKEAERLDSIVKNMLDFARPARLLRKDINIHKVLDSVASVVQDGLAPEALQRFYDPSLPPVFGDEGQLRQVFLNLMKNAKEAVPRHGRIEIVTRMVTDFHIVEAGSKRGKMASIEIRDNGCGIKDQDLEKVFTPFFTTKPKGSGLGMAISLKIVRDHGGIVRIESAVGKGTSVIVYLPVADAGKGA